MTIPYPTDDLGPFLAPHARSLADMFRTPEAMVGTVLLAVSTVAAQPLADVGLPDGHVLPLSLGFATIAECSDGEVGMRRAVLEALDSVKHARYVDAATLADLTHHCMPAAISLFTGLWDVRSMHWARHYDPASPPAGRRVTIYLRLPPRSASSFLACSASGGYLIAAPEGAAGTGPDGHTPEKFDVAFARRDAFNELIAGLLTRPWPLKDETTNILHPPRLQLSRTANDVWATIKHRPCASLAARLAGVLTLIENLEAETIKSSAMTRATNLAEWYDLEARRLREGETVAA